MLKNWTIRTALLALLLLGVGIPAAQAAASCCPGLCCGQSMPCCE